MKQVPEQILRHVLTIVGYKGDKGEFIEEFINLCKQQAFVDMHQALSPEKVKSLRSAVEEKEINVSDYFSKEVAQTALTNATQKHFGEYIQSILPTLSEDQKNELDFYLSSLGTLPKSYSNP